MGTLLTMTTLSLTTVLLLKLLLSSVPSLFWTGDSRDLQTVIKLPTGEIQGKLLQSRNGIQFASFEGVPYGEKPERWMPPEPKSSWSDRLDCTSPGPMCVQVTDFVNLVTSGSEDCLSMNIYTTNTNENNNNLPVLVFLHGGGMILGAGEIYEADFLVDHDVILVTINYRLDVLGFLSLDSPRISGNQALRDVQLALKWIKENIKYFGGDSSRVILSGQSGGSWAVSMAYASPLSESLFAGAIAESGVAIEHIGSVYSDREEALDKAKVLAKNLDCYNEEDLWNAEEIETCLRGKSPSEILKVGYETQVSWITRGNVDYFSEHGSVLPLPMEDILRFGFFHQVPLMIGTSSQESLMLELATVYDPSTLESYNEVWDTDGVRKIFANRSPYNNGSDFGPCDKEYAEKAKVFYFEGVIDQDDLVAYLNLASDAGFNYGTHKFMNYISTTQVPVYSYRMSFQDNTSFSFAEGTVGMGLGTGHGDELPYIFKMDPSYYDVSYGNWSQDNLRHSHRMCQLWANFARYGNPTPDGGSDILGDVKWEKYDSENVMFMDLGLEFEMKSDTDLMKRMEFWEETLANF